MFNARFCLIFEKYFDFKRLRSKVHDKYDGIKKPAKIKGFDRTYFHCDMSRKQVLQESNYQILTKLVYRTVPFLGSRHT